MMVDNCEGTDDDIVGGIVVVSNVFVVVLKVLV